MEFKTKIGEKELEIKVGELAEQASGSCLIKAGETTVLCTAQEGAEKSGQDFFPLTCDYEERFYAAGKILGSRFIRREGRPSTEAVLNSRLIDRAIRPLFPHYLKKEVQVIATCLSWDAENDPDVLSLIGSSIALAISPLPWDGPLGAIRIGWSEKNGFSLNPTYQQREEEKMGLVLSGVEKDGEILINMIELEGEEIPEELILEAVEFAKPYLKNLIKFQKEIILKAGKEKTPPVLPERNIEIEEKARQFLSKRIKEALYQKEKQVRQNKLEALKEEYLKEFSGNETISGGYLAEIFEEEKKRALEEMILKEEKRPDGRKLDEIREIKAAVAVLPRTHGSALFSRGETKALSILTLGAPGDQQLLEGMEFSGKKRFLHHYNFPPYSVGEIRPLRGPGRREIGHGALAEKALLPLIPKFEDFPYTIRIVSEMLSSNGSTSMASVSAATLALMDGGVPLKRPAAGIAIGIIVKPDLSAYKILTDIQGPEDSLGGMDFKVAGTEIGVTAIQLDVKIKGLTSQMIKEALDRAKKARLEILEIQSRVLACPRETLSSFAPRVYSITINPEKIGSVIGSGGRIINEIIEECNVSIDIEESGKIFVTAENDESAQKAIKWIEGIAREAKVGEIFQGKVKRILNFGAIVEIMPGQEGMVHISEFADFRIKRIEDVVKVNDIIPVMVTEIDSQGRINLSAKKAGFKPRVHPSKPQANSRRFK